MNKLEQFKTNKNRLIPPYWLVLTETRTYEQLIIIFKKSELEGNIFK